MVENMAVLQSEKIKKFLEKLQGLFNKKYTGKITLYLRLSKGAICETHFETSETL